MTTEAEAMTTRQAMALDDLPPRFHPRNPRTHDVPELVASLKRFGFASPVLICERTGLIAAGHGRVKALLAMRQNGSGRPQFVGGEDEDPWMVPVARGWSSRDDDELLAYVIADNRQSELGGWDSATQAEILKHLSSTPAGLIGTGYDQDQLDLIVARMGGMGTQPTPSEPIALPTIPITQRGDIWELGPHRIMCGDCRDGGDVDTLIHGAAIDLAVTSPPYADRRKYDEATEFRPIPPDEYVEWFAPLSELVAKHLAVDGSWVVNIKPGAEGLDTDLYVHDLIAAHVRQWGWHFATEYCWERTGVPKGPVLRLKNQFEPVYQFTRGRWKFYPQHVRHLSDNAITNIGPGGGDTSWDSRQGGGAFFKPEQTQRRVGSHKSIPEMQGQNWEPGDSIGPGWAFPGNRLPPMMATHDATGHPAAFPVGLPEFFVQLMTMPGETVYDPFVGSGSTVLAAHNQGRIGFGMELSPVYVDVAVARWQAQTGEIPTRIGHGPHDFSQKSP